MTNEEAQKMLAEVRHYLTQGNPVWDVDKVGEALDMAIEVMQAKTDGDLISRQDAVALVNRAIHGTDNKAIKEYLFDGLRKDMWSLPSAEPRKGKWVRRIVGTDYWHCSECGDYGLHTDFCPMCGADMRGEKHE